MGAIIDWRATDDHQDGGADKAGGADAEEASEQPYDEAAVRAAVSSASLRSSMRSMRSSAGCPDTSENEDGAAVNDKENEAPAAANGIVWTVTKTAPDDGLDAPADDGTATSQVYY